jgi:hypothetical protein
MSAAHEEQHEPPLLSYDYDHDDYDNYDNYDDYDYDDDASREAD